MMTDAKASKLTRQLTNSATAVMAYLYPAGSQNTLYRSVFPHLALLRCGLCQTVVWAYRLFGTITALRAVVRYAKALLRFRARCTELAPVAGPDKREANEVCVMVKGVQHHAIVVDGKQRTLTKALPLPQKQARFEREIRNLTALQAAELTCVPQFRGSAVLSDGTVGAISMEYVPSLRGVPQKPKHWRRFLARELFPLLATVYSAVGIDEPCAVDRYLNELSASPAMQRWPSQSVTHICNLIERFSAATPNVRVHRTLVHGDLNPRNVVRRKSRLVLLDWGNAEYFNITTELVLLDWFAIRRFRPRFNTLEAEAALAPWKALGSGSPVVPEDLSSVPAVEFCNAVESLVPQPGQPAQFSVSLLVGLLEIMSCADLSTHATRAMLEAVGTP